MSVTAGSTTQHADPELGRYGGTKAKLPATHLAGGFAV